MSAETPNPKLEAAITQARTSCLHLCQALSTLPRELRDMIYTHLTPARGTRIPISQTCTITQRTPFQIPFPYTAVHMSPHILNPTYVTPPIAAELSTRIYATSTFVLADPAATLLFLTDDMFKLDLDPFALVQDIEIFFPHDKDPHYTCHHHASWPQLPRRALLFRQLEALTALKHKRAVTLHVEWDKRCPRWVLAMLCHLAPWVYRMKGGEMGFDVRVVCFIDARKLGKRRRVEFVEHAGDTVEAFEAWKGTWPDVRDFGATKAFVWGLSRYCRP